MSPAARTSRRNGRPLVFMAAALAGWILMRAGFGSLPFHVDAPSQFAASSPDESFLGAPAGIDARGAVATRSLPPREETLGTPMPYARVSPPARPVAPVQAIEPTLAPQRIVPQAPTRPPDFQPVSTAASHNLIWMAAMAHVPVPREIAEVFQRSQPSAAAGRGSPPENRLARLLSLDSWLFLRPGGEGSAAAGPVPAAYGRSQAGAVLRYRLAPASALWPDAYLRADAALVSDGERQIAAGLSARPLASLPLRAHLEARVTRQGGRTELRPAGFVTAGTDAAPLMAGFTARSYMQAGYVGGRFATAFADGQLIAEREVARFDLGGLRAGVGAWGGAQRGARRLDIGPSAALSVRLGEMPARISVDYRVRVAGDAEPSSGAALTLSRQF